MKKRHKIMLFRLGSALLLLVLSLLFNSWADLFLLGSAYLIIGYDVLWSAARNIIRGDLFDENFLMAIATIGAWALGEAAEAVAVIFFYQVGELFQSIAVGKSRKSIASLMDIRPERAILLKNDQELELFPEEIEVGDILLVRPGDKIPLDGVVVSGEAEINASSLTGESIPQLVVKGDRVLSGTINMSGLIRMKVTNSFSESIVNKILDLVENAAEGKAKTERFITRFSRVYTPLVVSLAAALAIIPPLFFGSFGAWLHRALIFLVVSCPCALVISVPLSFFGGIGAASRKGVLIKGANFLEAFSKVKTVVFDKTGTLTKGSFSISFIYSETSDEEKLLELAALAESHSNHPIARSIVNAYHKPLDLERVKDLQEFSGKGIIARIDQEKIAVGNRKMMEMLEVYIPDEQIDGMKIHLAKDRQYLGFIALSDEIKEGAQCAIEALRGKGVSKAIMLSGDASSIAQKIGYEIGMDEIFADLLPHQKVEYLEKIIRDHAGAVAYIGDGINDAPVLTRADIGVAMGALGSDAAIEAADIVLMDDDLHKLSLAFDLSKRTMAIVWQNIIFAIGIKVLVMALGAFGLAGMWLAIFADVGVMILAILNAMRSLKF